MKILSLFFRLAVILSLMIGLYGSWTFLKDPAVFPVKFVKVNSSFQHVDESHLKATISPFVMRGFFNLSTNKLHERLMQFPWVAEVNINRVWPDKLSILIKEHHAIARWGNDKLLNDQGKIFAPPVDTFPSHLPIFVASDEQQELIWQYFNQSKRLLQPLGLNISLLELNARGALHLVLNNGIEVQLGRTDWLLRIQRLVAVYPKLVADRSKQIEYIDLRYSHGLAVR